MWTFLKVNTLTNGNFEVAQYLLIAVNVITEPISSSAFCDSSGSLGAILSILSILSSSRGAFSDSIVIS